MKRTGCAGCPFNKNFEDDLTTIKMHEPNLYKAVVNVFGVAYDYTRKFIEFKKEKEGKTKVLKQMNIFDYL
jgi:hypothetical protein